ncbi:MAG: DUF4070 domain-containing protein [Candidatus Wildermuthbacteria bacterium]|nr:DUF4070 domain-containing protein [Candidatus Wildermuthbacteria bacterium]
MKALLVYPEFPDTFWGFKHALPFIKKQAAFPPLGLATVAAMLPKAWNLRLVDLNIKKVSQEELAWADYVFVGAMTIQRDSARTVIQRAKEAGTKVVAGGPLFTNEHESFLDDPVDHFVLNEAEITLPQFLADVEGGNPKRVYQSTEFADVKLTPVPRWNLIDLETYDSMSVQWSRGCPYQCEFCDVTKLFGHRPRTKTSEQVITELETLWNAGWQGKIFFVDDNFIGNKKTLKEDLLPALIHWQQTKRHRVPFSTQASINLAQDPELVQMMVDAGFGMVFIGIETTDEASLLAAGKRQNTRRNLAKDVDAIQRAGLEVRAGFIVGFDNDTLDIFQRLIEFITESKIVVAMVGMLNAPHGTALWNRLKKAGRLRGDISGDNVDGTTNIVPLMDMKLLQEGHRLILRRIYSPPQYYKRMREFLKIYRRSKAHPPIGPQHFLAFFRAGWRLGILDVKGAVHYWFTLAWTLAHKPRFFPLAVGLAIQGYHFRRIADGIK